MPEKFDFSKIEDQKKFEKLPQDKQKKIIEETQEEAIEIKKMLEQRKEMDYASAARQIEARKHWQNGHLGVTAEDHLAFGGSPDYELMRNPGKTLGELWGMEEILEKLKSLVNFLGEARNEYQEKDHLDSDWAKDNILYAKKELRATISYLKSIGKLPKEFEDFEVQDLESDPKEKNK